LRLKNQRSSFHPSGMSRAPEDEQSCIGLPVCRKKKKVITVAAMCLNTEHITLQLEHLMPVGFIGQRLHFLYRQPKKSVGILWDYRHVGRFPDTARRHRHSTNSTLAQGILGKSQFIALMHALASEPPEHM
jgi:hypothetical protein